MTILSFLPIIILCMIASISGNPLFKKTLNFVRKNTNGDRPPVPLLWSTYSSCNQSKGMFWFSQQKCAYGVTFATQVRAFCALRDTSTSMLSFSDMRLFNLPPNINKKIKQMQPVWLFNLSGRQFEDTFKNTQWRKVEQMQPVWLCILGGIQSEETYENAVEKSQTNAASVILNLRPHLKAQIIATTALFWSECIVDTFKNTRWKIT